MADFPVTKFFDAGTRPPKGNWHFQIGNVRVEKHSESDILAEMRKFRKNNGTYQGEAALERELWNYYCSREPQRCHSGNGVRTMTATATAKPRELTPEVYGPWIWRFMNFAAARWEEGTKEQFLGLMDWIVVLLDCPICREEWRSLLVTDPPTKIQSRVEACLWTNRVHNEVNQRKGKQLYPYERGVVEYGFPPV